MLILHFTKGRQKTFAELLGYTAQTISNIVGPRKASPGYEILNRIVDRFPTVSGDWLLKGEGSMMKETEDDIRFLRQLVVKLQEELSRERDLRVKEVALRIRESEEKRELFDQIKTQSEQLKVHSEIIRQLVEKS